MVRASLLLQVIRSMVRFWGITLLNIAGLAIGTAAALTIALYVHDELSFDRFIPGAGGIFLVTSVYSSSDTPIVTSDKSPAGIAKWFADDVPSVGATARLVPAEWLVQSPRHQSVESFYWADPNIFKLLRFKAIQGDPTTALDKPYTMVVTQRVARRYFGRDNVLGETLYINGGSPVQITGVLADFPANNSLQREIFLSARSDYGMLTALDAHPGWQWASSYTIVKSKDDYRLDADVAYESAKRHWHNTYNLPAAFHFVRLTDLHFQPEADSQMAPRGHRDTVIAMIFVAALILFLAAINFAGLMSAQINERTTEMTIRHSLGAQRHHLFHQLFAEVLCVVGLSTIASVALAERLLPAVNAFLGLDLTVWRSPTFTLACILLAVATTTVAGLYPARALSRAPFRQLHTFAERHNAARVGWITVQFSLLIALLISSHTVYRQTEFATGRALEFDARRILQVDVYEDGGLESRFARQISALPGVEGISYSRFIPEATDLRPARTLTPSGRPFQFTRQSVDPSFFHLFGVRLLAGRNFNNVYDTADAAKEIIVSRSAAEALGYRAPLAAVGQVLTYEGDHTIIRSTIIGVADDMRIETVREPLRPMVFDNQSFFFNRLNIRLDSAKEQATLLAIDRVWKQTYPTAAPINRHYYSDYLSDLYHDLIQQWRAFYLLSGVGVSLSILGLTGLSIYLARAKQQETAIRSALGARTRDLVWLRLQPFISPLLVANAIAIVSAWALMSLWLRSFSTHVSLDPVSFGLASGIATLTALVTLTLHTAVSAPARSSRPLRHE